ncbi:hypothetical protein DFQ28_003338 [Apophysomyces sp. BC1034]|nr:hypothetical protein DFQ30_003036 [Apophysomyces sp. BC1015]KAG0179524.1 hypothetical protein DFQ29_002000 [Apophysomyces sp. BC1021]KAG0189493.1 hypothetical protein DFQ28_003338 [Apophysomyces sp. BC1034]
MESDTKEVGLYIAYGALMTMAIGPILTGSYASLRGLKRPANAPKSSKSESPLEDSDDEDETTTESLSSSDAWMFPVIGSGVLFSMYLLFKFLDKKYINYLITAYFSLVGCAAITKTALMFARKVVPLCLLKNVSKYKVTLTKQRKHLSHISFTVVHGALLVASIGLTVYYSLTKNWIASNMFGISFSINAIQLLSLDSFKTGMILLSGLFFYDIFWVFGTEVMVSVAKNFDAPIKVIWPRNVIDFVLGAEGSGSAFTMLGLGDIVIPALCLRFDRHMAWKRNPVGDFRSTNFPKPYFITCAIFYIAGLATTMAVMHFFHAAQPALLYLSPACILSTLLTAAVRGELKELFQYSTEDKEEEKKKEKGKKEKKEKKEKKTQDEGSSEVTKEQETRKSEEDEYIAVTPVENKTGAGSPKPSKKKKKGNKK